jgi:hypothetical protein
MAEEKGKRFLELQMDELLEMHGEVREVDEAAEEAKRKALAYQEADAEVAGLYADVYEYQEDLKCFEAELEILKEKELSEILPAFLNLEIQSSDEDRNHEEELQAVLVAGWTNRVENEKTHPAEQLELIKATPFVEVVEKMKTAFPDYENIETDIKNVLVKRWDFLVQIKKDHIKEEIGDLKVRGLKPHYAERVYKRYHGLK